MTLKAENMIYMIFILRKLVSALHLHLLSFSSHLFSFTYATSTQRKGLDNDGDRTGKEEPSDSEDVSIRSYL